MTVPGVAAGAGEGLSVRKSGWMFASLTVGERAGLLAREELKLAIELTLRTGVERADDEVPGRWI